MGKLRSLARQIKRELNIDAEPYLKVFCFHREGDRICVRYNTTRFNKAQFNKLHPYMDPDRILHSEVISPGEAPDAAYFRLFKYMIQAYQLERTRSGGYNISDAATRDALTDISVEELTLWASGIRGENIIPVKVLPTFKWKPSVTVEESLSRLGQEAYYLSIMDDITYETMYENHPVERALTIQNIVTTYELGPHVFVRPRLPSLKFLCQEAMFKANPESDPVYIATNSFISGGSYRGFLEATGKMAREHTTTTETPEHILTAYLRIMAKQRTDMKTEPYPLHAAAQRDIPFGGSRSAGINLHHEATKDKCLNMIVDYVWQCDKSEAENGTRDLMGEIVSRVLSRLEKSNVPYNPAWFAPAVVLHKMSMKVEARAPGVDPYKTRIIFVVNAIKTLLDKAVLRGAMKRNYGVGANAIGTQWLHGGADEFANSMGVPCPEPVASDREVPNPRPLPVWGRAWICLDISKFDQSVLATLLLLVLFLPSLCYSRDSQWWPVTRAILQWCLDRSVTKIVKWFGDSWRAIHGLMFSGEYLTSQGDSYYLELLFECFDIWFRDYLVEHGYSKEFVEEFERSYHAFKDYGDDGVLCYEAKYMYIICQGTDEPVLLGRYLKEKFFMELKMSDTYVCYDDPPGTWDYPSDVGFVTHVDHWGWGGEEIKRKGVKFLKRYFIRDFDGALCPWRPTIDYFSKSICVVNSPSNMARHVIRLRALACDTYGTNARAYEHLSRVEAHIVQSMGKSFSKEIADLVHNSYEASLSSGGSDFGSLDSDRIIHKIGGAERLLALRAGMPTLASIKSLTRRKESVLFARRQWVIERRHLTSRQIIDHPHVD